ncbi:hypothetical protein V8C86DRAFT_2526738 [Haematococcus lacustris]
MAPTATARVMTCKTCKSSFTAHLNTVKSCRYHSSLWSGGEVAKALGFVRSSDAPEHQLKAIMGRQGLLQFWDCCGQEQEDAPGCCTGYHLSYDDQLNQRHGWLPNHGGR